MSDTGADPPSPPPRRHSVASLRFVKLLLGVVVSALTIPHLLGIL